MSTAVATPTRTPQPPAALQPEHAHFLLRPPYEAPEYLSRWDPQRVLAAGPGSVMGVCVEHPSPDWSRLDATVRALRVRAPQLPVVLMLNLPPAESLLVSTLATRMHVRGVLMAGQPIREGLRRALTQPTGLGDDVAEWLTLVGVRLSPSTLSLVQRIFALAPHHHDLRRLLREAGTPESTARFQLHKRLLPPPSRWFHLARALNVALRIQARPDESLLHIALEQGFSDHSALCHQLRRAFRVRPAVLRRLLGWEWLLGRWLGVQAAASARVRMAAPAIDALTR